jgi:hypothetical protein
MKILLLIITSIFLYQCQTNSSNRWDTDIFEATQKLEADKLHVDIEIDGKKFYSKEVPFKGSIMLNKLSCLINLVNTDGGHIAISLEEEDWHKEDKKSIQFKDAIAMQGEMNGSFLIGRRQGDKGEGYFIKDGSFEIRQLNEEACIIVVQGILQNPFNETITKPINGLIVWKKPKVFANNPQANQFLFN